jgi:phosphoribosyl 1,2-cyclic phosphodiesterase
MAVETFLQFCKANDMSRVRNIHLLHMSNDRGNAEIFRRMVQEATGIPTEVCK